MNVTHAVTYKRKSKSYEAQIDGSPIGWADTRKEAELMVIEATDPVLARRIGYVTKRCGEFSGNRCAKAAKMLLAGHLHYTDYNDTWLVDSENDDSSYFVERDVIDGFRCQCADWGSGYLKQIYGAPFVDKHGYMCKHTWCVKLWLGQKRNEADQLDRPLEERQL